MHPFLKKLIGTWESEKSFGKYPTIKDFIYNEELTFYELGQPVLLYKSVTNIEGATKHCENGFIRGNPETNKASSNEVHNIGLSIVMEGDIKDNTMILESTNIGRLSTAKHPHTVKIARTYKLINEKELVITTDMETTNTELTNHLKVTYRKKDA